MKRIMPDWAELHLNTMLILGVMGLNFCVSILLLAIFAFTVGQWAVDNGRFIAWIGYCISVLIMGTWHLKKKERNLAWLLLALAPFGVLGLLVLENRNVELVSRTMQAKQWG